ncbi:MAG TPA: hypothetical protein VMR62_30340 [Bryobacteraceae bacterium]|nr:hypothetical protein [Bryobacteraceae bacterium]
MREQFVAAFTIGLIVVAVAVGGILYMQRGAQMDLTGPMSVRVLPTDADTALALVNLRITNPAAYGFTVHNVTVTLETKDGELSRGIVSRVDAQRFFDATPDAGPFHPTLYTNAVIPAHSTADYTLASQFSLPEKMLKDRKRFVARIEEINGKIAEFSEK